MSKKQNQGCLLLFIPLTAVCICIILLLSELSVGRFDSFLDGLQTSSSKPVEKLGLENALNIWNSTNQWNYEHESNAWEDMTTTYGKMDFWNTEPKSPTIWAIYYY